MRAEPGANGADLGTKQELLLFFFVFFLEKTKDHHLPRSQEHFLFFILAGSLMRQVLAYK